MWPQKQNLNLCPHDSNLSSQNFNRIQIHGHNILKDILTCDHNRQKTKLKKNLLCGHKLLIKLLICSHKLLIWGSDLF